MTAGWQLTLLKCAWLLESAMKLLRSFSKSYARVKHQVHALCGLQCAEQQNPRSAEQYPPDCCNLHSQSMACFPEGGWCINVTPHPGALLH